MWKCVTQLDAWTWVCYLRACKQWKFQNFHSFWQQLNLKSDQKLFVRNIWFFCRRFLSHKNVFVTPNLFPSFCPRPQLDAYSNFSIRQISYTTMLSGPMYGSCPLTCSLICYCSQGITYHKEIVEGQYSTVVKCSHLVRHHYAWSLYKFWSIICWLSPNFLLQAKPCIVRQFPDYTLHLWLCSWRVQGLNWPAHGLDLSPIETTFV